VLGRPKPDERRYHIVERNVIELGECFADLRGALGPVAIAGRPVASVENTTSSPCGTDRQRGLVMGCQEHGRQRPRSLVSRPQ
jgi:hypothetical protein